MQLKAETKENLKKWAVLLSKTISIVLLIYMLYTVITVIDVLVISSHSTKVGLANPYNSILDLFALIFLALLIILVGYLLGEDTKPIVSAIGMIFTYFLIGFLVVILVWDSTFSLEYILGIHIDNLSDRIYLANVIAFILLTLALIHSNIIQKHGN